MNLSFSCVKSSGQISRGSRGMMEVGTFSLGVFPNQLNQFRSDCKSRVIESLHSVNDRTD